MDHELLLLYASIYEKPRRYEGKLNPPSDICLATAKALRELYALRTDRSPICPLCGHGPDIGGHP